VISIDLFCDEKSDAEAFQASTVAYEIRTASLNRA